MLISDTVIILPLS